MKLDPGDVEAIARRVAELVTATQDAAVRYVDAAALARMLGVERDWVYAHAADLGAIRLGGPQGRLRFDVDHVRGVLSGEETGVAQCRRATSRQAPHGRVRRALDRGARSS